MNNSRALIPLSPNVRRNQELKPQDRSYIAALYYAGQKPAEIARLLNRPASTIYSVISRATSRHDFTTLPRSGRPKSTSDRANRQIIRLIQSDPFISYSSLQNKLNLSICRRTLYTIIQSSGYGKWQSQNRPKLTEEAALKRYQWALKYRAYTSTDWAKIVWSDECSIELGSGKRAKWCFRLNFHGEKWKKQYIAPVQKGKNRRVMVWAAFWGDNRSELVRLERDFEAKKFGYTASSYIKVLDEFWSEIAESDVIFMQDNAPIHTARSVTKWFENHELEVMEWPPYSPDLNPIEHLWFPLKEGVYEVNPNIEEVLGGDLDKEDILWEALYLSWKQIRADTQRNILASMSRRVEAVIEAKGWYTKY